MNFKLAVLVLAIIYHQANGLPSNEITKSIADNIPGLNLMNEAVNTASNMMGHSQQSKSLSEIPGMSQLSDAMNAASDFLGQQNQRSMMPDNPQNFQSRLSFPPFSFSNFPPFLSLLPQLNPFFAAGSAGPSPLPSQSVSSTS